MSLCKKNIEWVCKAYAIFGSITHVYWWLVRRRCYAFCQCAAVVEKGARDVWKSKTRELGIAFKLTCVGKTDEGRLVETVGYLLGLMEQGHIQLWRVQKHDIRWLLRCFEIDRLLAFLIYLNLIRSASWTVNSGYICIWICCFCTKLHRWIKLNWLYASAWILAIKNINCSTRIHYVY